MPGESSGEVRVDLRLSLDKLAADAQKGARVLNSNLASSVKGLQPTSIEREQQRERQGQQRRLVEQRYEWARQREEEAKAARKRATDQAVEEATRSNRARTLWRQRAREHSQDQASFQRNMMFGLLPAMGYNSPLSIFASLRQNFKAFGTTNTGASALSRMGLPAGAAGAGIAAAGITAGAVAAGLALTALSKAAHETASSFDRAAQLYSRIIQSGGLGSRYVIGQQLASRVMGGGDAYRAGSPGALAMQMTQGAANSLNQSMPILTRSTWEFRAAIINVEAAFARLAVALAPALNGLSKLINVITQMGQVLAVWAGNALIDKLEKATLALSAVGLMSPKQVGVAVASLEALRSKGISGPTVPPVPASPDRIPASTWEKMGLVVGMGSREDWQKKTAENTRRIAMLLERMSPDSASIFKSPTTVSTPYMLPRGGAPVFSPAFNSP